MRKFESGATRDTEKGKLDYEGFNSPLVELCFAQYMQEHRVQADGEIRDSDNWQKGIPFDAYMKSMHRHFVDLWLHHRGFGKLATEPHIEKVLCAIRFNINGYLFEWLRRNNADKNSHI